MQHIILLLISITWALPSFAETKLSASKLVTATPTVMVYSDPAQLIQVSPAQPEFIIQLANPSNSSKQWFIQQYASEDVQLVNHELTEEGQMQWHFRIQAAAFAHPKISEISFIYLDPANVRDNQVRKFWWSWQMNE
jgi:hypothetical protein